MTTTSNRRAIPEQRTNKIQCDDCGGWFTPHQWLLHWHEIDDLDD